MLHKKKKYSIYKSNLFNNSLWIALILDNLDEKCMNKVDRYYTVHLKL